MVIRIKTSMLEQNHALSSPLSRASRIIVVGPMVADLGEHLEQFPMPPYPTLFIDGGNAHQHHFQGHPTLSIGDGDSFPGTLDVLLPKNKNVSDLRAVLDLLSSKLVEIYFLGFSGGRKDHELINLGEIYQFLARQEGPCRAFFDKDFHAIQKGTYNLSYQGIFSMLAFHNTRVTMQGLVDYPLHPHPP